MFSRIVMPLWAKLRQCGDLTHSVIKYSGRFCLNFLEVSQNVAHAPKWGLRSFTWITPLRLRKHTGAWKATWTLRNPSLYLHNISLSGSHPAFGFWTRLKERLGNYKRAVFSGKKTWQRLWDVRISRCDPSEGDDLDIAAIFLTSNLCTHCAFL